MPSSAVRYLKSKKYAKCYVFLSHTLRPPHRELVERTYELLAEHYVTPFEYHKVNAAGDNWEEALDEQLLRTTHFVVLLTEGYIDCYPEKTQMMMQGK